MPPTLDDLAASLAALGFTLRSSDHRGQVQIAIDGQLWALSISSDGRLFFSGVMDEESDRALAAIRQWQSGARPEPVGAETVIDQLIDAAMKCRELQCGPKPGHVSASKHEQICAQSARVVRLKAALLALLAEPEPRAISEAEVEAGAKALRRFFGDDDPVVTQRWTDQARAVLTAANAERTGVK